MAAAIAFSVEKILDLYIKLIDARAAKEKLELLGMQKKQMQGITDFTNEFMKKGIEKLSVEITNDFFVGDNGERKNELQNGVKISLNKLANRIDQGFNIEVRAEPEEEPNEEDANEMQSENKAHIQKVIESAEGIHYLDLTGERILELPEKLAPKKEPKK